MGKARGPSIQYSTVSLTVEIRAQLLRVCVSYHVNISSGSRCSLNYEMDRAIGYYDWMPTTLTNIAVVLLGELYYVENIAFQPPCAHHE